MREIAESVLFMHLHHLHNRILHLDLFALGKGRLVSSVLLGQSQGLVRLNFFLLHFVVVE
jgi:hypothetical protein